MIQDNDKTKTIVSSKHLTDVREKIFSFCENQKFSDFCIIASDDEKFYTHKCVLAASSDYFMAMIGSDQKEKKEDEIKIHGFNGEILKHIIGFMYNGTIKLQSKTIEDILIAANFFQIKTLIMECYTFMEEELDVGNCLGIIRFADHHGFHGLMELYENASNFASFYFEDVRNEKDLLNLNEDQLSSLIHSENLRVSSEEIVFLSIIKWIEHDQLNREKYTYNLFSKVRYWFLSPNFIKQHRSKLQEFQKESLELICTWLEWHSSPDSREWKSMEGLTLRKTYQLVLISSDWQQIYNPELDTWTCERVPEFPANFDKVMTVNNNLVFICGRKLICVNIHTKVKNTLPDVKGRRDFGLANLNGMLYAVGGRNCINTGWLRCVDKFNFVTGKWEHVAPLNRPLENLQVAVDGGFLYAYGNNNGMKMECFEPYSDKWSQTFNFAENYPQIDFGFTGFDENVYIVGGRIKTTYSDLVSRFDLVQKKIVEPIPSIGLKLKCPKCISWNNQLVVFGGYDSSNTWNNFVKIHDPKSKLQWINLPTPKDFDCNSRDIVCI